MKEKEKEAKKRKDENDRKISEKMRQAAVERLAKHKHEGSSEEDSMDEDSASSTSSISKKDSKGKAARKRGTKLTTIQMLEKKYERKSDLKERESRRA